MTLVEDNRTGGFAFTWSIHNFSYCVQREFEFIDSPEFVDSDWRSDSDNKWHLRLYPKGIDANGFISYYLYPEEGKMEIINCVLSIQVSNGIFKAIGERVFNTELSSIVGYEKFVSLDKLKGPNSYLDNDTLTLRCRIWRDDINLWASVNCYAYTKIKVCKIDYLWILSDFVDSDNISGTQFSQSRIIPTLNPENARFKIHLLDGGTFGDDTIHFGIEKMKYTCTFFIICMIHLIDADGRTAYSIQGEYLFEDGLKEETQIWTFPFLSKHKLFSKKNLYIPNGKLTVRCELSVSTDDVNAEIERVEYGKTDFQLKTSIQKQVADVTKLKRENMQKMFQEGKFSDVTIHTPKRLFPVHKAILCAQSEVFCAMFERDMKENHTGVVEIEDLEDPIVSKMLMFLYTDTLEDLDFSTACKLFFAADKYRIMMLYKTCSNYLIDNLDASNVCDVLALADTHQDEELKSIARDFIFNHDQEIITSEDWKKLMEAKAHLTNETMQLMISNNLLGYHNHKKFKIN